VRRLASLVVAATLAVALAGCTASAPRPVAPAGCAAVKAGAVSNAVKVTGALGRTPTVQLSTPIATAPKTQRTVIHQGAGTVAKPGTLVHVEYAMYNGTTGKELTSTGFDGRTIPFTLDETKYLPGLVRTLQCSTVGSRVVGVIPPADAFHAAGSVALGIGAKDEIVFVADVTKVDPAPKAALAAPSGIPQEPIAGFPTVTTDAKGTPTVRVPTTVQPDKYMLEVLVKGSGSVVPVGSNVIVNDQVILWRTGKVLPGNDTWAAGRTAIFNTGQYFVGFKKAVEGQTVGSRIVFVVPPSLLYGVKGNAKAGVLGTDDLVFLVDILGIG
jgi:peptidylprolyl isomerase